MAFSQNDSLRAEPVFTLPKIEVKDPLPSSDLKNKKTYYSLQEAMAHPDEVYKLSLTGLKLKTFPADILRFSNLQELNLSNNKIKSLPDNLDDLPNLQLLNLAQNKLSVLPESIGQLQYLEYLYLAKNGLIDIPVWVGGLSKLRLLDITYNQLTPYQIQKVQARLPHCQVSHGATEEN